MEGRTKGKSESQSLSGFPISYARTIELSIKVYGSSYGVKAPVVVLSEMSFSASSFKGKMSFRDGEVEDSISVAASAVVASALIGSPSLYKRLICGFVQGVPTSLGYAKCNFLSEDPIKRGKLVILMM